MLSSMQGSLGIGANIEKWTPDEASTAKRLIAAYKDVQATIVQGDLYWLISPLDGSEFSATETVRADKSQGVVFAFIHSTQEGRGFPTLKLKGLDAAAEYKIYLLGDEDYLALCCAAGHPPAPNASSGTHRRQEVRNARSSVGACFILNADSEGVLLGVLL